MAEAQTSRPATVIWYDQVKGYGFLAVEGYPHDLFLHNSEVRKAEIPVDVLTKGHKMRCIIGADNKGRTCATDLQDA